MFGPKLVQDANLCTLELGVEDYSQMREGGEKLWETLL